MQLDQDKPKLEIPNTAQAMFGAAQTLIEEWGWPVSFDGAAPQRHCLTCRTTPVADGAVFCVRCDAMPKAVPF